MERYVIVSLLEGEALNFHEQVVNEILHKFQIKKQKLPAHFTIKAPFEAEGIDEILKITKEFTESNVKEKIIIKGISNFRDNVIFMPIYMGQAAKLNDEYFNKLKSVENLSFSKNEFLEKVYHCTIATHLNNENFYKIKEYMKKYEPYFETYFSNISILKWNKFCWQVYKKFDLK